MSQSFRYLETIKNVELAGQIFQTFESYMMLKVHTLTLQCIYNKKLIELIKLIIIFIKKLKVQGGTRCMKNGSFPVWCESDFSPSISVHLLGGTNVVWSSLTCCRTHTSAITAESGHLYASESTTQRLVKTQPVFLACLTPSSWERALQCQPRPQS